ncbi:YncE family protein [Rhodococcus sp. NPDC057135]|uniref:YncE family protein n=1 Tax=Rhodococcus sp. NPDC057135 TaxID=3346028 RepID=UPI0036271384
MKLQYRRRAVTASLAVAAAAVGLAVTAPAAHATPEDPTHGVVGSYSANQPGDIVVDSATHRGYITQYGGPTSSLSVVDTNTGTSVGSIDGVVGYPSAVAVDSGLGRAYVSSSYGGAISIVDTKTGKVEKTVTLSEKNPDGSRPQINDVVVDPTTHLAYFSDYKSGNIRVVDPNAADAVSSILVDKSATPTKLAFDGVRGFLYIADTNFFDENYGRTLWQADVRKGGALKSIARADNLYPVDVDVDTNTGNIYMTDTRATNLWAITPSGAVLSKTTLSPTAIPNGVIVDSAAGIAYVADVMNGHLWSVDLTTRATTALADTKVPALEKVKNLALDTSTGAIASTTNGGKVTVVAAYPLPATVELPAAQVGKAYSQKLTAADTRATFALTNGTLPGGLSLAQDGTISGTPTAVGSATVEITAKGVLSRASSVTVVVSEGPVGPVDPGNPGTGTGSLGNLPGLGSLGR